MANEMPRTLLVDVNRAAYPVYRALCGLGHDVWVVGGEPTEPLAKISPNYVPMDYSDADRLSAFVDQKGFDYLVPGCTDISYEVCAKINNGRFPGIESPATASAINTKSEFRAIAEKIRLPVPRVLTLDEAVETEPVIVKPVDSFSGRGITVLREHSRAQLESAFEAATKASKSGTGIVEEFVTGQLYSHSAFIRNGIVIADFIVREDCVASPFAVDVSRVERSFPAKMREALRDDIGRLSSALSLVDGLVHTQFIARGDAYWVIEMTRRCPGDIYALLIEFSTGYPYAESYAAPFIGRESQPPAPSAVGEWIIRHTASSKYGESLWGFRFSRPVDIRLFVPMATAGEKLGAGPAGRAGIFFFRSSTEKEQDELYRELLNAELYTFQ
jgi:biotin carboxylase